MAKKNIKVFISYADKDKALREKFEEHLKPLWNDKSLIIWDRSCLLGGADRQAERDGHLNKAHMILLLVSRHFLTDNDCIDETKRALERHKAKEARVIPIILDEADWQHAPFSKLQVLPNEANKNPKIWCKNDTTFTSVAKDIRKVVEGMIEKEKVASRWNPPLGWEHITPEYLENQKLSYSKEKLVKFFDGRLPDWDDAMLPPDILPQREIVSTLKASLEEARLKGEVRVILLEGAAGEGKSTALRQTVCDLVLSHTNWQVWWASKVSPYLRLPLDVDNLPYSSSETLLIVADDASLIVGEICTAVQFLRAAYKKNVVFLLSSQMLTWQEALIAHPGWAKYVKDVQISLSLPGISFEEAGLIVYAWATCGKEGLGKLKNPPNLRDVLSFYDFARPTGSDQRRSFLGAALATRYTRKDLEKHILALLDRLSTKEAQGETVPNGKTLVKALAFICAVDYINATRDADGLYLSHDLRLTTDIFAHLFSCQPEQVHEKFVIPLGDEAAANSAGNILYSRHQAIARVVIQHMPQLGIPFHDIYRGLIRSVSSLYSQKKLSKRDMIPWNQLPRWFFNTEILWLQPGVNKELGMMLVNDLIRAEPKNPVFYVDLSTFYRANDDLRYDKNDPEASTDLLRDSFNQVDVDRKYYYEWATAEGLVGNKKRKRLHHLRDIWLSGVSLTDIIHKKYAEPKPTAPYKEDPVDVERATLSLAGLASALSNFSSEESIFLHACAGAVRLGLLLNPHRSARQYAKDKTYVSLSGNKRKCEEKGIIFTYQELSREDCSKELLNIEKGIIEAYKQCQDKLPPNVPKGDRLIFKKLTQCVFECLTHSSQQVMR